MGKVLQYKNPETGVYEDFQTYRTAKLRKEAKDTLESQTTDKFRYKKEGKENG